MNINFLDDLADELKRLLKSMGLAVPTYEQLRAQDKRNEKYSNGPYYDLNNLLIHFHTVFLRRIPIKPWKVHISPNIKDRKEINDIEKMLKNGENMNALLSNKVKNLNQRKHHDLLAYEWGIYHFHFEESRSNELLFVYFNHDDAYLIDILEHERPDSTNVTWTNTNLIQIIHDNWPDVINGYIFTKCSESPILTNEQRKNLRKKSGNSNIIVSDGTEYMPLGGGFTSSKHPSRAIYLSDYLFYEAKKMQDLVENNFSAIKESLESYTLDPNLKLRLDDELNVYLVEVDKNICVELNSGANR